tara:strand:+ start:3115 stop:3651 length:537 start_codon:yes stop_codon:yes gene_type:complete
MEAYLEIILGPMFSGKTTALIEKYDEIIKKGHEVCVINYADDTRYSKTQLSTHDQKMIDCIQLKKLQDLKEVKEKYILINEAQFFDDLYEFVSTKLKNNKFIYLYGLDGDFQAKKFGQILDLIPLCDKVKKKTANCSNNFCENKAIFSHRISNELSQVVIGNNNYEPLCRRCYNKKND